MNHWPDIPVFEDVRSLSKEVRTYNTAKFFFIET
jgi:hypothetical protein